LYNKEILNKPTAVLINKIDLCKDEVSRYFKNYDFFRLSLETYPNCSPMFPSFPYQLNMKPG